MLIFKSASVNEKLQELLRSSSIKFYLTGSRFFGNATVYSDWDYFTQDDPGTRLFLKGVGFKELKDDDWMDSMHSRYGDDPNICLVLQCERIQIQLVKDAEWKENAQDLLNMDPVRSAFLNTAKYDRRKWWIWAFKMSRRANAAQP